MPTAAHQLNHPNLEYAAPVVIRPPSPTSTIGTIYSEDETFFSDSEHVHAFEARCLDRLGLGSPLPEEELAEKDPLIARLPAGSSEEKKRFEQILESLRAAVRNLEENELVDLTVLHGSCVGQEEVPSSGDITALMRNLMHVPASA